MRRMFLAAVTALVLPGLGCVPFGGADTYQAAACRRECDNHYDTCTRAVWLYQTAPNGEKSQFTEPTNTLFLYYSCCSDANLCRTRCGASGAGNVCKLPVGSKSK